MSSRLEKLLTKLSANLEVPQFLDWRCFYWCHSFLGPDILNVICRNWRAGEQRQRHQSDGNFRDADEEGWPDAGNQSEGNLFDVWHTIAHTHTHTQTFCVNKCMFIFVLGLSWSSLTCWRAAILTSLTWHPPSTSTPSGSRTIQVSVATSDHPSYSVIRRNPSPHCAYFQHTQWQNTACPCVSWVWLKNSEGKLL